MRIPITLLVLLVLLINTPTNVSDAQLNDVTSTILTGYVYDGFGNGIKDATVSALEYTKGTEETTTTDANGLFQFLEMEADKLYFIRISANGYYHQSKHDCEPGKSYTFVLERSAGVVGRITSEEGEPVKNATLSLLNPKFGVELYAQSDESGAFRFTSSDFEKQLYQGDGYEIYASAEGYVSSLLDTNLTVTKGIDTFVNFTLNKSGVISGTVRGSTGERVTSARVYAFGQNGSPVCTDLTDENGEYVLNTDLTPENYKIQVSPPEDPNGSWLNSQMLNVSIAVPGGVVNNVNFNLDPAAILKGNVSDEHGALENAMVTISSQDGKFAYGVSDASGSFSISSPALTAGTYTVRAECPHHLWAEKTVVLAEGAVSWVDLNLSKSRSVSGYLRTVSGLPLFGSVEIFNAGGDSIEKAYTNQDGYYKLDTNLIGGIYRIEGCAPGYIGTSRTIDLSTEFQVENLNFTLTEAGKAVVNLTDYAGSQVVNAMGYLICKSGDSYTVCETGSSGANGTIVFGDGWQNLAEGTYSLLVRNAPGCEERFFENLISVQHGTTKWYSVVLNRSAEVCGHAYYRKVTEPLEDVQIEFTHPIISSPFSTSVVAWTDTDGYFHVMTGLSDGDYNIAARHHFYGSAAQNVTLSSGQKTEVNIFFGTTSGTGGILGVVKEKDGNELSGVTVSVYNGTRKIKSGTTNESGYFFLPDIPEGNYRVIFTKTGYTTLELSAIAVVSEENTDMGTVEMEKYIPPPGNITGYVVDTSGNPVPGASIIVEGTGTSVISDSMGEFEVIGLKEGVYSLLISCAGYKDARETVSVTSGNNTTVWIQLEKEVPVKTTPDFTTIQITLTLAAILLLTAKIRRKKLG
ncbi:MAG: carboxypeptidase regulatory-like domain-containing protein [Thermoplasmata archaeon]|nr:carboxypeptidase regulatory-like domain-containing protein [Thermoplasmata archaeon]